MDWLLVVVLAVQSPGGAMQTIEKRESVRSELACHTAIMRHMDTKGQQVLEAECLRSRTQRVSLRVDRGHQPTNPPDKTHLARVQTEPWVRR